MGSPSFRIWWSDAWPILKRSLLGIGAAAATAFLGTLMSPEFQATITNNFGQLVGGAIVAVIGVVGTHRFVSDNS